MVCLRESIYCASGRHHLCDGGQSPPASQLDGSICTCPCHLPVCEVQVTAIERVPDLEKIEVVWPAGGSNQLVFICASCAEKGERIVELEARAEKAAAEVDRLKAALENILSAKRARHSLGVFGQLVESIAEAALRGTKEERNGR